MDAESKKQNLMGLSVKLIDERDFYSCIETSKNFQILCTVNAQFIGLAHENSAFKSILEDNLCCIDGQVTHLLYRMFNKTAVHQKFSGSELVFDAMDYLKNNNKKVLIVGGQPKTNKSAIKNLNKLGVKADGYSPPYGLSPDDAQFNGPLMKKIEVFRPDLLYVCLGAYKQELWLSQNKSRLQELGCSMGIGLGGSVNLLGDKQKRCPPLLKKLCLESIFRLVHEPRLFRVKRILYSFKILRYLEPFQRLRS